MKKALLGLALGVALCQSCSKEEYDSFSTIYGVVTDAGTGAPVASATLTLSPGGMSRTTDGDGRFEYTDLDPQQYTLTAQKTGYQTNRKMVTAIVGERVEGNITLTKQTE